MKVSRNWLSEFVDLSGISDTAIVNELNLKTAETAIAKKFGAGLSSFSVVQIVKVEKHPNADSLSLVTIDTGTDQAVVVCGAKNFVTGDKAAYAKLGTVLPDGMEIGARKIRGVLSEGMLCSEAELDFSEDSDGIIILDPDSKLGQGLDQIFLDHQDCVFEIDNQSITHRPDLWSHYGLARELSALFERDFYGLKFADNKLDQSKAALLKVIIEDKNIIPRFSLQGVEGIVVKPSTALVKLRLHRLGLRSINNVVDVTNYVMLATGQPMHAFDLERIKTRSLQIKAVAAPQKFEPLFHSAIELKKGDVAIFDGDEVAALGGVIGGVKTAIDNKSHTIALEAGNWQPSMVRKTAIQHDLKTDAAIRYEKALDKTLTLPAINIAINILKDTCPDLKVSGGLFDFESEQKALPEIILNPATVCARLGAEIPVDLQIKLLNRLFFSVSKNGDNLLVKVPSWRATRDINLKEDLIEEIGRLYGYNNIEPQAPLLPVERSDINRKRQAEKRLRELFVDLGYGEVLNFPFSNSAELALFPNALQPVALKNVLQSQQTCLKTSLLPHLLKSSISSEKLSARFSYFELSRIYFRNSENYAEQLNLGLAFYNQELSASEMFGRVLAHIQKLLQQFKISDAKYTKDNIPAYADQNYFAEITSSGKVLGQVLKVDRSQASKTAAVLAELNFDLLFNSQRKELLFTEPSKFPPVFLDLSVLCHFSKTFFDVAAIAKAAADEVVAVSFVDRFPIESTEMVSLTIKIKFRSANKTLSPLETSQLQTVVIDALAKNNFPLKK